MAAKPPQVHLRKHTVVRRGRSDGSTSIGSAVVATKSPRSADSAIDCGRHSSTRTHLSSPHAPLETSPRQWWIPLQTSPQAPAERPTPTPSPGAFFPLPPSPSRPRDNRTDGSSRTHRAVSSRAGGIGAADPACQDTRRSLAVSMDTAKTGGVTAPSKLEFEKTRVHYSDVQCVRITNSSQRAVWVTVAIAEGSSAFGLRKQSVSLSPDSFVRIPVRCPLSPCR